MVRPGCGILEAHQPAVGPAALAARPPEDGGIGLPLPVRSSRGEGDQEISRARVEFGVLRPCGGGGPGGIGSQVGIDQDRPELFLPTARVEIGQGAEAQAVGLQLGIALQQLGTGLAAVAVGQPQHRGQVETGEVGGRKGVERRLGLQRNPFTTALRIEPGHLQPATLEQPRVSRIAGIPHDRGAHIAVEMAAVAVAAGIHHQGLTGVGAHGHGLMAEAAQGCVLNHRALRPAGVDLHHPAVLVARQAKGIAEALEPLPIEAEGALRRRGGAAIGVHRLHHMGLNVLLGGEHRAPGRLAAGAVGEAADHPIAEAVVVTEPLAPAEHRRRRSAALQAILWTLQPSEAADAPVVARFRAAAAATPALIGAALDLSHPEAHVQHGGGGHLQQGPAQGIVNRQSQGIHAAAPLRQEFPQLLDGQFAAHHLSVGGDPGEGADVFEIHREQRPRTLKGSEGEVVIVVPEATAPERITPLQQHLTAVTLREQELIVEGNAGVGALLLRGTETIGGQGDGAAQGVKRKPSAGPRGGSLGTGGWPGSAGTCSGLGQTGA